MEKNFNRHRLKNQEEITTSVIEIIMIQLYQNNLCLTLAKINICQPQ